MRGQATASAVRTHVVTGPPAHVLAALQRAAIDGRLAGVHSGVELPGRRVQVTADLRDPARPRPTFPTASMSRWLRPALIGLLVAAALGGAIWGLVLLVSALITALTAFGAWLGTQLPLIVAIGVVLLVLATPAGARCVGVHCGGCRR